MLARNTVNEVLTDVAGRCGWLGVEGRVGIRRARQRRFGSRSPDVALSPIACERSRQIEVARGRSPQHEDAVVFVFGSNAPRR